MKSYVIIFISLILVNSIEEAKYINKRLTFKETLDPENTHYILNAEEEYKEIKNLKKMKYTRTQVHIVMNGPIIQRI